MIRIIGDDKVKFNKKFKLSKAQMREFSAMDSFGQLRYLASFINDHRLSTSLPLRNATPMPIDRLAAKPANQVLGFNRAAKDKSANHKPWPTAKGTYVGIEIECLFEGASIGCDNCDSVGTIPCSNCDGTGEVCLSDNSGNDYELTCAECSGDGYYECSDCDGVSSDGPTIDSIRDDLTYEFNQAKVNYVSIVHDGSLSSGGLEVRLLLNIDRGFEPLLKVCRILNDAGASVDQSCGLHVHLDYRSFNDDRILLKNQWSQYLKLLTRLQPESRRENNYCKARASLSDRYSAVNLSALEKHNTVEVRCHTGSTNYEKIRNWIELLVLIKNKIESDIKEDNYSIMHATDYVNATDFETLISPVAASLESSIMEYFKTRFNEFNPSAATSSTQTSEVPSV